MIRFYPVFVTLLWSSLALGQTTAPEPVTPPNPIGTAIFGLLFLGFCVGFAWLVWRNHRKEKQRQAGHN